MRNEITFEAKLELLIDMISWVRKHAEHFGFQEHDLSRIELATEEALVNIINYAYPNTTGEILLLCKKDSDENKFHLELRDKGTPHNPLLRSSADIEAPIEERGIGGYGVHFMKTIMDELSYTHDGNFNSLKMMKIKEV
jgi:serine/threonine-protein kinase RsbW